ncbi:MAG: leucine-rich repeat protein [Clostridia bacterium]|nr:leucine-rich repeat protein [Clostridia bacterium]
MKKLISILLAAVMLIGMIPFSAFAADGITYIDADGNQQTCTDYKVYAGEAILSEGWWLVRGSLTTDTRISVSGSCNIILADNAVLTANAGIAVNSGNSLTIYAVSADPSKQGKIVAGAGDDQAAIGGNNQSSAGIITINGGNITVQASSTGAGIGGGKEGNGGTITINGGTVTSNANSHAAAIGGGWRGNSGTITINGGTVVATISLYGSAIGGGGDGGNGESITINGGNITARSDGSGAGIGGGKEGSGGTITVTGGNVSATATFEWAGAAIGGGYMGSCGNITISGGRVNASGATSLWASAAIGSGPAKSDTTPGNVNITGGIVIASSGADAEPIGKSGKGSEVTTSITGGIVFQNGNGALYRDRFFLYEDLTVNKDNTLTIGADQTLFIEEGVTLDVQGNIVNNGRITNYGLIKGNTSGLIGTEIGDYGITFWPAELTTDKYDVNDDGAKDSVYEISDEGQLYWFAALVNGTLPNELKNPRANAVLTNDITVNSKVIDENGELIGDGSNLFEWTPIDEFRGIFDGRGYDIKGLYYNDPNHNQIGLFKYTNSGSVIRNLGVIDSYFSGNQSVGAIAGQSSSTVYNCHSNSTVVSGIGGGAGGITGYQATAKIYRCYNTGLVTGWYHLGGIAGSNYRTEIADCYNSGSVVGTTANYESDAGGIVGYHNKSSVQNCYNIGSVEGYHNVAQIVAYRYNTPTVDNCYYLSDTETAEGGRTAEQFASGEMTWILNGESHNGSWKQTLGEDAYPVFEGDTVYYGKLCSTGEAIGYTNEKAYNTEAHYSEDGYCEICGLQPAHLAEDGYYEIYNKGQLYWFADFINRYVYDDGVARVNGRLMADIVINDVPFDTEGVTFEEWTPIGYDFYNFRYGGTFDGNGHTISGLYIDRDEYYTGFIGVLGEGGIIKDLGIINSYINGGNSVGGIAGISASEITNCFVINTDVCGVSGVGGIVGARTNMNDSSASINNCFSMANAVTDSGEIGGITSGICPEGSYYLADTENDNGAKTSEQFESGEVAYLLGESWGQSIGTDPYPVLGGATVYAGYDCGNTNMYYSNTPLLSEEDSYHVPSEWTAVEGEAYHIRYVCTREVCEMYNVTETQPCSGHEADCQNRQYCTTCGNSFGDYDMNNHTSEETYYLYDEETGTHTLYHVCCDSEIITEPHDFAEYDFNDTEHWLVCVCGACDSTTEAHSFDAEGFCVICGGYEPAYLDEENYRYEISKAGHLFWFARSVNTWNTVTGDAVLTADIDLNPGYTFAPDGSYSAEDTVGELRSWTPIGKGYAYYTGTFDGGNHTVSGLYMNDPEADMAGLFGNTMYNYPISNIKLTNGYLRADSDVGALIANAESVITNCHSDITVVGSGDMGGLVGYLIGGGIYKSSNTGDVSFYHSGSSTGGIVGNMYSGEIVNCSNTGHITGTINTGGIAGNSDGNPVANCLNLGIVESGYFSTKNQIAQDFTNSYYLAIEANDKGGRTAEQLASGEITWLLQSAQSEEDVYDEETWEYIGTVIPTVWTQTIGTDEYPTLNAEGDIVYRNIINGCCEDNYVYEYSNTEKEPVTGHIYIDGVCACGAAQPTDGQQVVIGDYTYTYYTDHATGAPEGWNAVVNDKTLSSYGAIEAEVNGLPVTQLYKTFAGCTNMTEAPAIPEGVKVLYNTFKNCTALTSAPAIPEGVENMTYAFWGCSSLTETPELPESVKILKGTFYKCTALTSAPELIGIEDLTQAFDGCTNLTGEVTLATDNAAKAFRGTNVTSVKITKDVTEIAQGTFDGCNITDITYEGTGAEFAALTIGSYNGSFRKASVKVTLADTPSIVSDGKRTYICDLENIKDLYIGKGTLATYREVKNNLCYGMTSAKLGDSNIYTYGTVLPAGEYTLYVRYVDGTYDCVNFTVE